MYNQNKGTWLWDILQHGNFIAVETLGGKGINRHMKIYLWIGWTDCWKGLGKAPLSGRCILV